ncbi:unnamed protein product [marine sediment metagenome]|uniref:Uncharacterized protein n=1 Tax=marine sediment metagenome TaxID=412755 RepID=X1ES38_9ZZZZ
MQPHYFLDIYHIGQQSHDPINEIEITDKTADELEEIIEKQEAQGNEWRLKRTPFDFNQS